MNEIKVNVVRYRDRANLVMRYLDPETSRQVQRSTGTTKRREAERIAAKWEAELREGRYQRGCKMGWLEFREYHEANHLAELADRSVGNYRTALNAFERICRPRNLSDVTTRRVTRFKTDLRNEGLRPASVANYVRHLRVPLFIQLKLRLVFGYFPSCLSAIL